MIILGINVSGFHSSACILIDGEIKSAITEERLSRVKRDKSFPKKSILYCCKTAGINLSDITNVYIGWNPSFYLNKSDNTLKDALKDRGKISYLTLNELSAMLDSKKLEVEQNIKFLNGIWKINYVNHHFAHLSNSFLSSGFSKSDFFIADGFGEHTTGMLGYVDYKKINKLSEFRTPHSLGNFYSTFTEFLGFCPNGDEWKVMALASLGDPKKYYNKIRNLVKVNDINFELDLSYFEFYMFYTNNYYSLKFIEEFGQPVSKSNKLSSYHYDLVASLQKVVEDIVFEILNNLQKKTKSINISLSGEFFMNSVLNGKILKNTNYQNIYIGGSPDDSGISLGSALYGYVYEKRSKIKLPSIIENYYGCEYSDDLIIKELNKRKIKFIKSNNIEKYVAKKLKEQNIVAWFQGKSEFGQRALGNRSILADPTIENVKENVNSSIKYREGFRPFAPSVLEDKVHIYFNINTNEQSYFMEKVFMFKKKYHNKLPGVVHYDGTGRLQSVSKKMNLKYYNLIKEFEKISGYPILLNTSFNINGMPLVETPSDAIDCFFKSGIDYLILNNFIVKK